MTQQRRSLFTFLVVLLMISTIAVWNVITVGNYGGAAGIEESGRRVFNPTEDLRLPEFKSRFSSPDHTKD
jgi:hypothetical protein